MEVAVSVIVSKKLRLTNWDKMFILAEINQELSKFWRVFERKDDNEDSTRLEHYVI